jgi:hypothetical protein
MKQEIIALSITKAALSLRPIELLTCYMVERNRATDRPIECKQTPYCEGDCKVHKLSYCRKLYVICCIHCCACG